MTPFTYARAGDAAEALTLGALAGAKYLGGGTNLVDLIRETVERPASVVDVTGLASGIEERPDGSLLIGAEVTTPRWPSIAQSASAIRCSRARSWPARRRRSGIWRRSAAICSSAPAAPISTIRKVRAATSGRRARAVTRSAGSIASTRFSAPRRPASRRIRPTWPWRSPRWMRSCICEAPAAERTLPLTDLHRLPGDHPEIETMLEPGELITAIELPPLSFAAHSTYRKVRDRASYAFALVSVAAALEVEGGTVKDVRLALGGVAHKPWRALKAEAALRGGPATDAAFRAAAEAELADAQPLKDNGFKIELAKRTLTAVLAELAGVSA